MLRQAAPMSNKHEQQRGQCLVCRERRPAEALAWLVADRAGGVVCDLKGQLHARRVSVCLERRCLDGLAVHDLAQALGVDALDRSTVSSNMNEVC